MNKYFFMSLKITTRQQEILDYLRKMQRETGVMPSTREIQRYFGFASQTAVISHLRALERKGELMRLPGKARAMAFPRELDRGEILDIPIYGRIAAGYAQEVDVVEEGSIALDASLLGAMKARSLFALRVRGESMIDAQICDGDLVILEKREGRAGDIVAALIDGEVTLKRLVREASGYFLRAENPAFPDLLPLGELSVQGVMVGLMRSM